MSLPRLLIRPIRVLLIDNYAIARAGLRLVIESSSEIEVVGEAGDIAEAMAIAAREQPDIILLSHNLSEKYDFDRLLDLIATTSNSRVVILAEENRPELYHQAIRSGIMGWVLKNQTSEILLKAIKKVYGGEVWLDRAMMAKVLKEISRPNGHQETDPELAKIAKLTGREREVVRLIGEGLKNKDIANRLFICEGTVRHHLTSIFYKLGTADRLELIIYAYRHGLAELPQ